MSELKRSINRWQIVGTLVEMNLVETTEEVNIGTQDKPHKVTCKTIRKKDFKNPSITVETNGSVVGVNFYNANEKKLDDFGKVVDNDRYKAMSTILNTYVPKMQAKDGDTPTRVSISCSVNPNEYATEQGEWKSFPQITAFQCSSTSVSEEDVAEGEISGVVKSITQELKGGEDAEETGRLIVDFYSFDNNGKALPLKLVVEEDIADDFKSMYSLGDSCKLNIEILTKHVGAKKVETGGGFGRKGRDVKLTSGYDVTEYSIFRGSDPFDEENEHFVSIEDMKNALKERDVMIEQKKKDKKEKGSTTNKSSGGLGNREPKVDLSDENPFL